MAGIEGPRRVAMPQEHVNLGLRAKVVIGGFVALAGCSGNMEMRSRICEDQPIITESGNRSIVNSMNVRYAQGSLSFLMAAEIRVPDSATGFADEIRNGARMIVSAYTDNAKIIMDEQGIVCLANCAEVEAATHTHPYTGESGRVVIGQAVRNFEGFIMLKEAQDSSLRVVFRPMIDRKWAQPVQYGLVGGEQEVVEGETVYRGGGELKRFTMRQEYNEDGTMVNRGYEVDESGNVASSEWLVEEDAANRLHDRSDKPIFTPAQRLAAASSELPIYHALYLSDGEGTAYVNTQEVLLESGERILIPVPDSSLNSKDYQLILDLNHPLSVIIEENGGVEGLVYPTRVKLTLEDLYPVDSRPDIVVEDELLDKESPDAIKVDITGLTHGPETTLRAILEIGGAEDILNDPSRPIPELAVGIEAGLDVKLVPPEGEASCPPREEADAGTDVLADAATDTLADVPIDSVTDGGTE